MERPFLGTTLQGSMLQASVIVAELGGFTAKTWSTLVLRVALDSIELH